MPLEAIYDPLLDQVVSSQLLLAAANKQNLADDPEIKAQLARAHDGVLRDGVVKKAIDQGVTDEKLKAAYEAMKSQPGFAFEETQGRAHPGRRRGARRWRSSSSCRAGPISRRSPRRSRPTPRPRPTAAISASSAARPWCPSSPRRRSRSQPGTVGDKPVKSQFGWHVIKVEDRRQTVPTFEEKEPELREQLSREIVTALLADVRDGRHDRDLQHRRHAQAPPSSRHRRTARAWPRSPTARRWRPDRLPAIFPRCRGAALRRWQHGIRYRDRDDLTLIEVAPGSTVAGVFTRSTTAGHPVVWCREILPARPGAGGDRQCRQCQRVSRCRGRRRRARRGRGHGGGPGLPRRRRCSSPRPA